MGKLMLFCVVVVLAGSTAPAAHANMPAPTPAKQARLFGTFKVIGCVLGVGTFIAGNMALVLKVKRIGGIVKFAKKLWHAKSPEKRAEVIAKVFGSLSGVGALIAACTP